MDRLFCSKKMHDILVSERDGIWWSLPDLTRIVNKKVGRNRLVNSKQVALLVKNQRDFFIFKSINRNPVTFIFYKKHKVKREYV
jgi:hypothetical protein